MFFLKKKAKKQKNSEEGEAPLEIKPKAVKTVIDGVLGKSKASAKKGKKDSARVVTEPIAEENPEKQGTANVESGEITDPANKTGAVKTVQKYHEAQFDEFARMIAQVTSQEGTVTRAEDLPIIKIVDKLFEFAYLNRTSDIHIEPFENQTLVRFRIDGLLHDIALIPKNLHRLIITRIKILSRLRTDEQRAPQDGRLRFKVGAEKVDVRVSIIPVLYGEKVVLRLLSAKVSEHNLEDLGFSPEELDMFSRHIKKPWGMILVTGPTGCGKTTTLYAVLKKLNRREVNISTIEDPVEYDIEGINQIQVNSKVGLTFAAGLRSIVRQDPNIIMVGEIRDEETAKISIDSALTGHLVLSTLHTNDAATTFTRLLDMGVEPFLVASTVNLTIGQRLVRKICDKCKREVKIDKEKLTLVRKQLSANLIKKYNLDSPEKKFYIGGGCQECQDTGYRGRLGIFELLEMDNKIKEMIMGKANAVEIAKWAMEKGMVPMVEDGLLKAEKGLTTLEEILRVAKE